MPLRIKLAWFLTLFRLAAAPVWVGIFFLVAQGSLWPLLLAALLELTDALDGYLSRYSASTLGAVVDPLADSLFHLMAMLSMGLAGHFAVWWVLPLLYREGVVAGVETIAGIVGRPCFSTRREVWKSRVLATTILGLLALWTWRGPEAWVQALLWLQAGYCAADGLVVVATQWRRLRAD